METGPKAGTLAERLEAYFGNRSNSGIRVNEIRFIAEDAGFSEARVAATLTAKTLGADADRIQEWSRSQKKMIHLIAAAEGAHGMSGGGAATGSAPPVGAKVEGEVGWAAGISRMAGIAATGQGGGGGGITGMPGGLGSLEEAELRKLLQLLSQFGEAQSAKNAKLDPSSWQQKIIALPQNTQATLQQALATVAAQTPTAKVDENMLLHLAEDLAIRFAIDRYQRGEVKVNAVRQLLDRMGHELDTLRKLLKSREDKLASAGMNVESHADVLDRQFWAAVPESGKRHVL